jgi:tRNA-intron endonuclease
MKFQSSEKNHLNDFPIFFSSTKIFSNSQKAINLADSRKLGEISEGKVIYSPYEVLFLLENFKAKIYQDEKEISEKTFTKKISKQIKSFETNYLVFEDLTKKGFSIKTGSKFGTEFRVSKKSEKHSKWILFIVGKNQKIESLDFVSKNRIAHSTGKKLLIAIVESERNINYFESDWTNLK